MIKERCPVSSLPHPIIIKLILFRFIYIKKELETTKKIVMNRYLGLLIEKNVYDILKYYLL